MLCKNCNHQIAENRTSSGYRHVNQETYRLKNECHCGCTNPEPKPPLIVKFTCKGCGLKDHDQEVLNEYALFQIVLNHETSYNQLPGKHLLLVNGKEIAKAFLEGIQA